MSDKIYKLDICFTAPDSDQVGRLEMSCVSNTSMTDFELKLKKLLKGLK